MKENNQIKIDAELVLKSSDGSELQIHNTDKKVIINFNYRSLPSISLSNLKRSWSFRKKSKYLSQDIYFFANHRLILNTKKGRIVYRKPFFIVSLLVKSLFYK